MADTCHAKSCAGFSLGVFDDATKELALLGGQGEAELLVKSVAIRIPAHEVVVGKRAICHGLSIFSLGLSTYHEVAGKGCAADSVNDEKGDVRKRGLCVAFFRQEKGKK